MTSARAPAFTCAVEVLRRDGARAAQVPLPVDWEPAVEWARFHALREGVPQDLALTAAYDLEPVWDQRRGAPYLDAIEVRLRGTDRNGVRVRTGYFAGPAGATAGQLVKDGVLQEGEVVRFHPLAFPHAESGGDDAPARVQVAIAAPRLPVRSAPLPATEAVRPEGTGTADDHPVVVAPEILAEAAELAVQARPNETGGILIGHLCRDPETGTVFAEVTAQIPARQAEASTTRLTFAPETWTGVRAALELRARGEIMLGWWHSHPVREWCAKCPEEKQRACAFAAGFLSEHDRALHRAVFPRAYSVALVVNDVGFEPSPTYALFGWREGLLTTRGFSVPRNA